MTAHTPIRELTTADQAIVHILRRIAEDPDTRWALGWGSESFRLLCLAYADLVGEPVGDVEKYLINQQAQGKSAGEVLRDLMNDDDHVRAAIAEARGDA